MVVWLVNVAQGSGCGVWAEVPSGLAPALTTVICAVVEQAMFSLSKLYELDVELGNCTMCVLHAVVSHVVSYVLRRRPNVHLQI
jgi:hypothetical protein